MTSPTDGTVRSVNNGRNGAGAQGGEASDAFLVISKTDDILVLGTVDEGNKKDIESGMAVTVKSRVDDPAWKGTVTKVEFEKPMQWAGGSMDTSQSSKYAFYVSLESREGLVVGQHVYILADQGESFRTESLPEGRKDPGAVSYQNPGRALMWKFRRSPGRTPAGKPDRSRKKAPEGRRRHDPGFEYMEIPAGVRVIDEEVRAGLERLEGVAGAALYRTNNGGDSVYYRNTAFTGTLSGVDARYFDVNGIQVTKGRGITKEDHEERRKVALVDQKTAASLFAGEEPVGSILEIRREPFLVVGVCGKKNAAEPTIKTVKDYYTFSGNTSGAVYIPIACWDLVFRYDGPIPLRPCGGNDGFGYGGRRRLTAPSGPGSGSSPVRP